MNDKEIINMISAVREEVKDNFHNLVNKSLVQFFASSLADIASSVTANNMQITGINGALRSANDRMNKSNLPY